MPSQNERVLTASPEARIASTGERGDDFSALFALLNDVRDRLVRIENTLEPRRCSRTDHDDDVLKIILPALGAMFGPSAFTAGEALADPAIRVKAQCGANKLGAMLARAIGRNIEGLTIVRSDSTEHGRRLWSVMRVLE
jgi:hypothetical protein